MKVEKMWVELELFTQDVEDFPSDVCFSDNNGATDVFVSKEAWANLGFPHFITVNIAPGRSVENGGVQKARGTVKRSTAKRVTRRKRKSVGMGRSSLDFPTLLHS